jgi:hypothetical protein
MIRVALASALTVVPLPALAQRTMHAPLAAQLPLGARGLAMGGAHAGSRDPDAALLNPALAGTSSAMSLSVGRYRPGVGGGVAGTGTAIGSFGVALTVSYLDYIARDAGVTDRVLVGDGVRTGRGASVMTGVALSTQFKGTRYGLGLGYLEERLPFERASAASLTLGAARVIGFGNGTLGVALQHLAPSLEWGGEDLPVPSRLAAGLSGVGIPLNAWFDLGLEGGVAVRRDGLVSATIGSELLCVPIEGLSFAARAGLRRPELASLGAVTLGAGVALDRFALDYAWERLDGGSAHRVGVRVR